MMIRCSNCQKDLTDLYEAGEIKYHSPIESNGNVNHVWCDAYCSVEWHHTHGNNYELD